MENELISIIIPVYNVGMPLKTMAQCVQNQTYKNWELLLIDDGSTDGTSELCDTICQSDERIKCLHGSNEGVSSARNKGLAAANGACIAFLDGDDTIDSNYLQALHEACKEADIAVCDVSVEADSKESYRFTLGTETVISSLQGLNYLLTRKYINSGPCAKLIRKNIIKETKFPPLRLYEDILFNLDIFQNASKIAVTNKTAYHYIQNNSGAMASSKKTAPLDAVTATETIVKYIKANADLSDDCLYVSLSHLMQYAVECFERNNADDKEFLLRTKKLFASCRCAILNCKAFPKKEKIVFLLFSFGYYYSKNRVTRF